MTSDAPRLAFATCRRSPGPGDPDRRRLRAVLALGRLRHQARYSGASASSPSDAARAHAGARFGITPDDPRAMWRSSMAAPGSSSTRCWWCWPSFGWRWTRIAWLLPRRVRDFAMTASPAIATTCSAGATLSRRRTCVRAFSTSASVARMSVSEIRSVSPHVASLMRATALRRDREAARRRHWRTGAFGARLVEGLVATTDLAVVIAARARRRTSLRPGCARVFRVPKSKLPRSMLQL